MSISTPFLMILIMKVKPQKRPIPPIGCYESLQITIAQGRSAKPKYWPSE